MVEARDEELLARVAGGDISSLRMLYERYKSRLMTYACYVLGTRASAEDVVQETFLRVFRHAGRFDPERRFSAWVYAIAANLCRDELRRNARRRAIAVPFPPGRTADSAAGKEDSPLRGAAGREFAERLRAEIADLAPEQREVIALRYLDSMKYHEIAEALGCPLGTVQSRLHAGLKVLRERLRDFL
jgi:RNA polymerase sigma-70 factor (ECF subfamily)